MNESIASEMSPFVARLLRRAEAAEAERDAANARIERLRLMIRVVVRQSEQLRLERDAAIRRAEAAEAIINYYDDPDTPDFAAQVLYAAWFDAVAERDHGR